MFEEEEGESPFDLLRQAVERMDEGIQKTLAGGGLDAMAEAFSTLGQAVGQAVHAFVLFGSAGTSVRKVTAQVLASVAQMAAVKAVFELAEGFAALALAFFGIPNAGPSASAHFAAAAVYASIAGVAALAGRAVAGNSFNNDGGGESGTGPRSTTARDREQVRPIDLARTQRREEIHIFVHGEPGPGFGDAVINTIVRDVQRNGASRDLIVHTAGA